MSSLRLKQVRLAAPCPEPLGLWAAREHGHQHSQLYIWIAQSAVTNPRMHRDLYQGLRLPSFRLHLDLRVFEAYLGSKGRLPRFDDVHVMLACAQAWQIRRSFHLISLSHSTHHHSPGHHINYDSPPISISSPLRNIARGDISTPSAR